MEIKVLQDILSANDVIIGEVVAEHPGKVLMKTRPRASRIVDMPAGELLPGIC